MSNKSTASSQIRPRMHRLYSHNISCLFGLRHHRSSNIRSMDTNRMVAQTNGIAADVSSGIAPRKLKILMLHGYTQNGPLFHAKTKGLEKLITKAFPAVSSKSASSPLSKQYPGGVQLFYPTGPIRLLPADLPGFDVSAAQGDTESDSWGWWKREVGSGTYAGLEAGLDSISGAIRSAGGIDGVIGFSQGAAGAAMVASLLEKNRQSAFLHALSINPSAFAYPESWKGLKEELGQGPLKFAVSYSGFYAPNDLYKGFYEPKIATPMCHFIGSLDSVVEESRSLALVDVCTDARKVYHPGGHFVPAGKEMVGVLVGFVRSCCEEKEEELGVEDMDVPF